MTDDRRELPGSGEIETEGDGDRRSPSDPQPIQQFGEEKGAEETPGRDRGCIIYGLIGGCGCALLVLLLLLLLGVISLNLSGQVQEDYPGPQSHLEESHALPEDEDSPQGPGREAALAWARDRDSTWQVAVDHHSEDWTWVRLVMAPDGPDPTAWVELRWDRAAGRYEVLAEGPIAQDITTPPDAGNGLQPGDQTAREAALEYVREPGWVTRIDSNSADWTTATVSVGPPASEWVWVVNLQWNSNRQAYDLVSVDDVDHPGF